MAFSNPNPQTDAPTKALSEDWDFHLSPTAVPSTAATPLPPCSSHREWI